MKYGLGQIDLNLLAQLALSGFSDTPERDIADLMRSKQPIEDETRRLLAEVLDGRGNGVQFKIRPAPRIATFQAFARRRKRLKIGREAIALGSKMTIAEANRRTATKYGCSEKSVESFVTFARRVAAWSERMRQQHGETFSDIALDLVFCYAEVTKKNPDEALKPSANYMAEMILKFDAYQGPALRGRRTHKFRST